METYTKEDIEIVLQIRLFLGNHQQLSQSDVLIFHCPLDLQFLDIYNKPSILYEHRAGRPTTFMFEEIMKRTEDMRRRICERDRKWINNKLKELYQKADVIINNSKFTQSIMKKYFNIDTFIVCPSVDLEKFNPKFAKPKERKYFLSIQRPDWQKRLLLQIDAFKGLKEKLIIVGGKEKLDEQLENIVKEFDNIKYLGHVSDRKLINLYAKAKATIQTAYFEDFGIVPIESFACGTPVIVVDEGGFKESVHNSSLGIRVKKPYLKNLRRTIVNWDCSKYNPKILRKEAEKYSLERFKKEMEYYVKLAIDRHNKRI